MRWICFSHRWAAIALALVVAAATLPSCGNGGGRKDPVQQAEGKAATQTEREASAQTEQSTPVQQAEGKVATQTEREDSAQTAAATASAQAPATPTTNPTPAATSAPTANPTPAATSAPTAQASDLPPLETYANATYCIQTGTMIDQLVLAKFPNAKFSYFNTIIDGANAVVTDPTQTAVVTDPTQTLVTAGDLPTMKYLVAQQNELVIIPEMVSHDSYGMAVHLKNTALKKSLDSLVAAMRADGRYDDLCSRWFPEQGRAAPMPAIDFSDNTGPVLRFGTCAEMEPFSFYNQDLNVVGFDVEIVSLLAESLNRKLEIVPMDFGGLIPSLASRKVDVIAASITISKERAKKVLFTEPYYYGGICVVIKKPQAEGKAATQAEREASAQTAAATASAQAPATPATNPTPASATDPAAQASALPPLETYANATYCIQTGTMIDQLVLAKFPNAKFSYFNTLIDGANAVVTDPTQTLVTAGDLPTMKYLVAQQNELVIIPEMVSHDSYGMAVHLENTALKKSLDSLVAALRADGRYDDLCSRWFPEQGRAAPMPAFDFTDNTGPILRFGTYSETEPFSFYDKDLNVVGFDVEVVSLLAESLNRKLEIVPMDFGGLIPSLAARKVDIIAASITISEERAKKVLFSEPYYYGGICVVIKKPKGAEGSREVLAGNQAGSQADSQAGDAAEVKVVLSVAPVTVANAANTWLDSKFPHSKIIFIANNSQACFSLSVGKLDKAVGSSFEFRWASKPFTSLVEEKEPLGYLSYHFAFPLDSKSKTHQKKVNTLRSQVNTFIAASRANGTWQRLVDKWSSVEDVPDSVSAEVVEANRLRGVSGSAKASEARTGNVQPGDGNVQPGDGNAQSGSDPLRVMLSPNLQAPHVMVSEDEPQGLAVEYCYLLGAALNRYVQFTESKPDLIMGVQEGTDFSTEEAAESSTTNLAAAPVLFSDTYFQDSIFSYVNADYKFARNKKNKKKPLVLAVLIGSEQDLFATEHYPNMTIQRLMDYVDLGMSLKQGLCDAILVDAIPATYMMKEHPEFVFWESNISTTGFYAAFPKADTLLRNTYNRFLDSLESNGLMDEIMNRWIHYADKQTELPDGMVVHVDDAGKFPPDKVLRVGTAGSSMPYSFFSNGHLIGLEVELTCRFAASLDKVPVFSLYNFNAMLAALASHNVDMAVNNVMKTEEREKNMSLSQAELISTSSLVVLQKNLNKEASKLVWLHDASDFGTAPVGLVAGDTIGMQFFQEYYPTDSIHQFNSLDQALNQLAIQEVWYVMTNVPAAREATRKRSTIAQLPRIYTLPGDTTQLALLTVCKREEIPMDSSSFFGSLYKRFFHNVIQDRRYILLLRGLKETALISLFAALIGTLLGALVCKLKMGRSKFLRTLANGYIALFRGIPQVVMLMVLFYIIFAASNISGMLVASFTFALFFAASTSEQFRTAIESLPKGQREAGLSLGLTELQTFWHIILPQAVKIVFPVYKGEIIAMIKMTSIVGYIAVQDLTKAGDIIRSRTFDALFPLLTVSVLYFVIVWVFTWILDLIGPKSIRKKKQL